MKDPLKGSKRAIWAGEKTFLTGEGQPPVKKGEVFTLFSGHVEVGTIRLDWAEGKRVWFASLYLHKPETSRVPAQQQGRLHPQQYVSGRHGALEGASEEVPEDYQALLAQEGRAKTVLLGATGREAERKERGEAKLKKAKERGSKGTQRFQERMAEHQRRRAA